MGDSKGTAREAAAHALDGQPLDDMFAKLGFVLSTFKPPAPTDESTEVQRGKYEQWESSDKMVKCYIMATMSDVLQQQHEGIGTAADIMMSLEEMFAMRSRTTKREAVIAFMNLTMKSVQAIAGDTKIDMIVNSLSDSFDQCRLDYTLNNKEYILQGLMQDVQSAEKILVKGKGPKIHMVSKVATVKTCKKVKKQ
ncbi:hypothetical protein ACOSQ4_009893 [Xanthoceras sorbifolium]